MGNYFRYRDAELVEHTTRFILENLLRETGFQDVPDETMRGALADMYAVTQEHWLPEPDALPTLNQLSKLGYQMALVSNAADDENTQTLVDKLGAKNYFSAILSSAAIGIRKPDPRIFQMALEQMNASPNQAVMVGDTLGADILGAKNVGIYSIWITRRADTAANKTHVKTIIPDTSIFALSELPDLLESLSRSNY
jgi:putative hydrolase of the HAD superfamily